MSSTVLKNIKLTDGESNFNEYHVIQEFFKPWLLRRIINMLKGKKPDLIADGYVFLTNKRLAFFRKDYPRQEIVKPPLLKRIWYKIFPPTRVMNDINFSLVDTDITDVIKLSVGYQKQFKTQHFIFSAETIGFNCINLSSDVGKGLEFVSLWKIFAPIISFYRWFVGGERVPIPTPQAAEFCREIGAKVAEFQRLELR